MKMTIDELKKVNKLSESFKEDPWPFFDYVTILCKKYHVHPRSNWNIETGEIYPEIYICELCDSKLPEANW